MSRTTSRTRSSPSAGGAPVTNTNGAFAFASCKACTTVAVSFQVVLVVGRSKVIAPINAAGALNVDCPACTTVALADQIVVTLSSAADSGTGGEDRDRVAPARRARIARMRAQLRPRSPHRSTGVQQQIDTVLRESGQMTNPPATTTQTATTTTPTQTGTVTTTPAAITAPTSTTVTTTPVRQTTTSTTTSSTTTVATTTTAAATTTTPATTTSPATTTTATTTTATTTTTTTTAAP